MRRLRVDLSGLWRCVGQMGDPTARFMIDEEDGGMQETYRGKDLLEIASRHDLDTYAYGGRATEEFIVIGTPRSIRNLSRLMEEIDELRERLHDAQCAFEQNLDHWMNVNDGLIDMAGELTKLLKDAAVAMEGTNDQDLVTLARRIRAELHEKHLWVDQNVPHETFRASWSIYKPEDS